MSLHHKYKLNKNITSSMLKNHGFRNGIYKCYIYKNCIMLIITIDIDEKEWDYKVFDINNNALYANYYSREFGTNDVVRDLDNKINDIFKEMIKQKIFVRSK